MSYTLSLATREARDLVVEALHGAADQRTRVAVGAAREVAAIKVDDPKADVRSKSVKVTAFLAQAGELHAIADELAASTEVAVITVDAAGSLTVEQPTATADTLTPADLGQIEDDGTSPAAQAIAALAGLTPADPDDITEDPLTGALREDEPVDVEPVLT